MKQESRSIDLWTTSPTGLKSWAAFLLGLCLAGSAVAKTLYVDRNYGSGGDGSAAKPYNSIQTAINDFNSDIIIVYPGIYKEKLKITKNLTLRGYDGPHTTIVDASSVAGQEDVVDINRGVDVWIEGLKISGGKRGVYQPTQGTLHLRNCVICNASSHGIYIERSDDNNSPTVYVFNCILVANGGSGLYIYSSKYNNSIDRYLMPNITAYNNVFISNQRYAVEYYNVSATTAYRPQSGTIFLDYNDMVGNTLGSYSACIGLSEDIATGNHCFEQAPEFVGAGGDMASQDMRLLPTSPCRNAGNPGIGFLDPDGTRNDIGAYGGPGAQTFYTSSNDGPIVRGVTIDQGLIPRGGTFIIRATGAVR
jgi:hypothetical protein